MYRSAPTLAAIYRAKRCLLLKLLEGMKEEAATEAQEERPPPRPPGSSDADWIRVLREQRGHLDRRRYGLGTARINRWHAISSRAEPITDVEEALRLGHEVLEAVDAGDTDRVLRLVGRI